MSLSRDHILSLSTTSEFEKPIKRTQKLNVKKPNGRWMGLSVVLLRVSEWVSECVSLSVRPSVCLLCVGGVRVVGVGVVGGWWMVGRKEAASASVRRSVGPSVANAFFFFLLLLLSASFLSSGEGSFLISESSLSLFLGLCRWQDDCAIDKRVPTRPDPTHSVCWYLDWSVGRRLGGSKGARFPEGF